MKKINWVFLILFIGLCSCNNDDDNTVIDNNTLSIIGTWTMETYIDSEGVDMLSDCQKETFIEFFKHQYFQF